MSYHLSRKEFQVFKNKNVSSDARVIAVIVATAYFVMTRNASYVFTVLKFFYLAIFMFEETPFLAKGNFSKVHFQECGKYF